MMIIVFIIPNNFAWGVVEGCGQMSHMTNKMHDHLEGYALACYNVVCILCTQWTMIATVFISYRNLYDMGIYIYTYTHVHVRVHYVI